MIDANASSSGIMYGILVGSDVEDGVITKNTVINHLNGTNGYGIFDASGILTSNRYFANVLLNNTNGFNFLSINLSIFTNIAGTPGAYQNVVF